MNKWLNLQIGKNPGKASKLQQRGPNAMEASEKIVQDTNSRALSEVESQTDKIVAQSKLDAQKLIDSGDPDALRKTEEIMTAAWKKTETLKIEAKQKALQVLVKSEEHPSPQVPAQKNTPKQVGKSRASASLTPGALAFSGGNAVIFVYPSGGWRVLSILITYLQGVTGLEILGTIGSETGTTITVVLDKPERLESILSQIPGLEVILEPMASGGMASDSSFLPIGGLARGARKVKLNLKEA